MNGQQLKNSILQLAIQGKLVPQDLNDEPASALLSRIREEKKRLVEKKKIKKDKPLAPIKDEEKPFEIPESWEWVRLGEICIDFIVPQRDKPTSFGGDIPWCRIEDIEGKYLNGSKSNQLVTETLAKRMNMHLCPIGTVICACSASIGNQAITTVECYTNQTFIGIVCSDGLFNEYLYYYMSSQKDNLKKIGKGTTISYISRKKFEDYLFPLPPLAEQHRIVEKIEELLPLVEEYDDAQTKLDKLNNELPEKLKKSVLQQAILGRLDTRNDKDEPASALLARIREEKKKLVEEKKIKKDKPLAPIKDEEKPFEIPDSWEWVRLGEVSIIARGGSPRPIKDYLTESSDGINWIKIGDTDKDGKYINSCKEKIKIEGLSKTRKVYPGDFLLTNSMSFGRPYITNIEGCIHDGWLALSGYDKCYCSDFLYYLLLSPYAKKQFGSKVAGAVVKNLNTDKVADSVFPLPPLAEQHRIVEKIEELLTMIERLKLK